MITHFYAITGSKFVGQLRVGQRLAIHAEKVILTGGDGLIGVSGFYPDNIRTRVILPHGKSLGLVW